MPSVLGQVTTADGLPLRTRHWPMVRGEATGAGAATPWAHVLLVHGLGEHSGRYEHVGDQLAAAGLEAWGYDHRGQGASGGRRGDVSSWSQLHDDLGDRLAAVRVAAGERPVVLYGHSMGGLIVAGYCLSDRPEPDLVVLSSPALTSNLAAWKQAVTPFVGRILPTLSIPTGIDGSTLSRDPSIAAKTAVDPLCVRVTTARFGAEGIREQARVRSMAAGGLGRPTLVLHGLDDRLVDASASEPFDGAPLTERRTFPGLRHELHNEPEGPDVIAAIIDWLREAVAARDRLTVQSHMPPGSASSAESVAPPQTRGT